MDKLKRGDAAIKVYKPNPLIYLMIALIAIFWLILASVPFLLALATGQSSHLAVGIGAFLMVGLGAGSVIVYPFTIVMQESIAIHEDGLEYYSHEKIMFSNWKDLESLGVGHHPFFRGGVCGIYTKALAKKHDGESFLVEGDFFFPLNILNLPSRIDGCWGETTVDTKKLMQTEFGQYLFKYAPHLFELEKEKQKNG